MQIVTVRTALAAACTGITVGGLTVTPYSYWPDSVVVPAFVIGEPTIDPDVTFGTTKDNVIFACKVLTSRSDDRAGQEALDTLLSRTGSSSIRAALEAARGAPGVPALGGAADDLHVESIGAYRLYIAAGEEYYGAELKVRVIG